MAAPIANQRQNIMKQILDRLEDPHRGMLREFAAAEDRDLDDPVVQETLVDAVGASTFTLHFGDLGEMGLVETIGKISRNDGETTITQPRFELTDRGRSLVSKYGPSFDPKQVQGEVEAEPEVRQNPDPIGREPDRLTDLSGSVDAFVENTESVVLREGVEHRPGDPRGTVEVTLNHEGLQEVIEFPAVNWHNSGLNHFFDQLHAAFGAGHDLDQREWGILQQQWIDMAEVIDPVEVEDAGDRADQIA